MMIRMALLLVALAFPPTSSAHAENLWWDAMSDRWHGVSTSDAITDGAILGMYVVTSEINGRYSSDLSRLMLICESGKARLRLEWTFKAAGSANLSVEYRFEGQPGRAIKARYVNRSEEEATSESDIRQFLTDAGTGSRSLMARVSSDIGGVSTAKFRTRGGPDMVKKFTIACPGVGQH